MRIYFLHANIHLIRVGIATRKSALYKVCVQKMQKNNKTEEKRDEIEEWLEFNWDSEWCDPSIFEELLSWLEKFYKDIIEVKRLNL